MTPAEAAQELLDRRKARRSLRDFVLYTTPGYIVSRAHEALFTALEKVMTGVIKRLMVFMPPQNGKSTVVSKRFPAWFTGHYPGMFTVMASYEQDLATTFGRELKNLMESQIYANVFPGITLAADSKAASRWNTKQGGGYYAVGVGSGLTGRGSDLGIIDDPVKDRRAAESKAIREQCKAWYRSTFFTRRHTNTSLVLCMTRWHEDDLAGWLLREGSEKWDVLDLPAIADQEDDKLGRKIGEALWPEMFPLDWLENTRRVIGQREFDSLYQRKPSSSSGHILKREHFRYWTRESLPAVFDDMQIYVDANVEEGKGNDYTVLECWGKLGPNYYLLDLARDVMGMSQQLAVCQAFYEKHPAALRRHVEDKANGPAIVNLLSKSLPGLLAVAPASPRGNNKVQRAMAVEPFLQAGNIFIPEPGPEHPWVESFVEECAQFPNGDHDDQVDAFTGAINWWTMNGDGYKLGFGD